MMQSESPPQTGSPPAPPAEQELAARPALDAIFQGRLHPLTLVFAAYKTIRRMIIPAIPLLIVGNRGVGLGLLALLFLISVAQALARYFSFSYRIEGGELITSQGLLARKQRNIPLERVQEIRIEQGVLHRLFGVVDANVETAGGQGPEASLSVLARAEAERLRQAVFERVTARKAQPINTATVAPDSRQVIRRLNIGDLILAGATSNHLVTAFLALGTLWAFVDDIFPESIYETVAKTISDNVKQLLEQGAEMALLVALLGVLVFLLTGILLSIIGSVVLFYGFTLSRLGEDLHRSYGLLTQRSSSLPRRRIQVLEIEENLMRRLFRLATLRADIVGTAKKSEEGNKGRDVLIPVVRRDEVSSLLTLFFPDLESEAPEWRRVSRLAVRRGTIKGGVVCAALALAGVLWQREVIGLWPLALLPLVYAVNVVRYHNLGYALGERYFRTRRGWLGRSTHIVPIGKTQAVEVRQTPFDRRLGLATLIVDTAGQAYTGGGPRISNLPLAEAHSLARTLAHRAAATQYKW
ncbi:MAG TPA: PH domain-containing protein [Blastocatellia bacterium]|nr:PH domain-containing protein [Blastocatellia bacterium]